MPINLRIAILLIILLMSLIAMLSLRAEKTKLKYTLVWLTTLFLMLVGLLIPNLLESLSKLLGFEVLSNMVFLFGIFGLSGIVFSLTVIVSRQDVKLRMLIQEISLLRNKIEVRDED